MKIYNYSPLLFAFLCFFSSCNKDEGIGGSSSIEGYVYEIRHLEDHSLFPVDTVPAVKQDVQITYGNDETDPFDDKAENTNEAGLYQFTNLREGNYVVTAYSSYPNERTIVWKTVKVTGRHNKADTLFIHTWYKAKGSAMIRGQVNIKYYNGYSLEHEGVAVERRVFLKFAGQDAILTDERTDNNGVFIFQELPAGKYEIYTTTETINEKNITIPTESQYIEIIDEPKINDLESIFEVIENT